MNLYNLLKLFNILLFIIIIIIILNKINFIENFKECGGYCNINEECNISYYCLNNKCCKKKL